MLDLNYQIFKLKNTLIRRKAVKYYSYLMKNQILDREEIKKMQFTKIKKLVEHAYSHSKFYNEKYNSVGFSPRILKSYEDIIKIPVLTKTDLRNNFETIIIDNFEKKYLRKSSTGGSTGVPISVYHDLRIPLETIGWRMLSWWKILPSDNILFINRNTHTPWEKKVNDFIWWPTKRFLLDASRITEESVEDIANLINRNNVKIIQGYVGAITNIAEILSLKSIKISANIKAIWTTAAPISNVQRTIINNVFNAPIYDQYGCGEVYWIGAECHKNRGLHIFEDVRLIEVVDSNNKLVNDGGIGNILITDMENYIFPIIRYRVGDMGSKLIEPCDCGISFGLINPVRGRESDFLMFQDGTIISGEYLTTIFDENPFAVSSFQVIQQKNCNVILKCVPGKIAGWELSVQKIFLELKSKVPKEIECKIELVEKIENYKGKNQFIIKE